jgi:fimbrial isopeptide formation D2 family protein
LSHTLYKSLYMKNLLLLFSFSCAGLFHQVYSQNVSVFIQDSSSMCSNTKYLVTQFSIGNTTESNPVITANWGDGSIDTILPTNLTFSSNADNYYIFDHSYANAGIYAIQLSFESDVTSDIYLSNVLNMTVSDGINCGQVYSYIYQENHCGNFLGNFIEDGVFDLTGNDNAVTQFSASLSGVNLNNVPYTLSINDEWLMENNLTQTSPDLTITSFDAEGNPVFDGPNTSFEATSYELSTTLDLLLQSGYSSCFSAAETGYIVFSMVDMTCFLNADVLVSVELADFMTPVTTGLTNPVVNGNTLTFEIHDFNGFGWIDVPVTIPGTTEAGLEYTIHASISDLNSIETSVNNNAIEITGVVFNSYDPNDKSANQAVYLDANTAEELQYTINFQNEGNFAALKVVVRDTLSANLDLSTFKVLSTKHNVVTTLNPNTRVVTFTFNNINLVPSSTDVEGSKGRIVYEIKENENLPVNSEIENTAYIYFDFNPAIITNTTYNTNTFLSVSELKKASFSVYPNPAGNSVKMSVGMKGNTLRILDMKGKEILKTVFDNATTIDISGISNGIYSLVLENKNGISIEKLVIQH